MRVEALPTPSDHVPAVMERVKPLYLSRTYGIPLPDESDKTKSWDPEEFLDKLARMKGRLLKHGEPDLDSVAKIILSDWVRGRIPFFVPPPERPEDLNIAEARAKKKAELKGKSKVVEENTAVVPGVKQNLGTIMQKNTFLPEDIQPLDEEFLQGHGEEEAGGDSDSDIEEAVADKSDAEDEQMEEDEVEMTWDEVWEGIDNGAQTKSTDHGKPIFLFLGSSLIDSLFPARK